MTDSTPTGFASLGLPFSILRVLEELGYEAPSPIQAQAIPSLLEGRDVLGMAQTGTGKTAAFALPLLTRTQADLHSPQVLCLAPTRELAQQVAEAVKTYSKYIPGLNVVSIYGGAEYGPQLRELKRGPQWVVGTPGRVMDHLRRGSLELNDIRAVVLDEADEMLRMGFIDDVNWILEQAPRERQTALFSATMPKEIQRVAEEHLKSPVQVRIEAKTTTNANIRQRYWFVGGAHKNDAMLRICETEDFDAMMVFVRTKQATEEVADFMLANGFKCAPLNGDIPQALREKTVEKLKNGQLDIIVATDVAARGLDVERISHVINYDIPSDTESYVHRIGRTGRAGRSGDAIVFVRGREKRMLRDIEHATRQSIEEMALPSAKQVNEKRAERFQSRIVDALGSNKNTLFRGMIEKVLLENPVDALDVAAALASLLQGNKPLFLDEKQDARQNERRDRDDRGERKERGDRRDRGERSERPARERSDRPERGERADRGNKGTPEKHAKALKGHPEVEMLRYAVAIGYEDGLRPGNLVGAIANEADLDSEYIGHIEILDNYAVVDLPDGMPKAVMNKLKKARVCGRPLEIEPFKGTAPVGEDRPVRKARPKAEFGRKDFERKPKAKTKKIY
ncbi:MAG: DEAD/DEAH box helicase [Venatoribacter sp.]